MYVLCKYHIDIVGSGVDANVKHTKQITLPCMGCLITSMA